MGKPVKSVVRKNGSSEKKGKEMGHQEQSNVISDRMCERVEKKKN